MWCRKLDVANCFPTAPEQVPVLLGRSLTFTSDSQPRKGILSRQGTKRWPVACEHGREVRIMRSATSANQNAGDAHPASPFGIGERIVANREQLCLGSRYAR